MKVDFSKMNKKGILKLVKEYSFLIFLIIYILVNLYLGGKIDWGNFFLTLGFVLVLNAIAILITPYLVDYKKLKELNEKMKEIQKNPFSALTMQEELIKMLNERQQLTMRYSLITMLVFLAGVIILFQLIHGNVWENFKIELPYLGGTINAFWFYFLLSLSLAPLFTSRKKDLGLI